MKKRGWGYVPPPKSRTAGMRERTGVAERLDSIARDRAERQAEDKDNTPLIDTPRRMSLAERTMQRRQQLGMGLDLDAQVARDKEAAFARPNSPGFIQQLIDELGLSELGARAYALALRSVEMPEPRLTSVSLADPVSGRTSERITAQVLPSGHPMLANAGLAHYTPSRIPAQAILGLPPDAPLSGLQRAEAARIMEAAHAEWESRNLLEWLDRGALGLLRI
jgi:hypothetical protein